MPATRRVVGKLRESLGPRRSGMSEQAVHRGRGRLLHHLGDRLQAGAHLADDAVRTRLLGQASGDRVRILVAQHQGGVGDPLHRRRLDAARAVIEEMEQQVGGGAHERARGPDVDCLGPVQNALSALGPSEPCKACQCRSRRPSRPRSKTPRMAPRDGAASGATPESRRSAAPNPRQ